MPNESIPQEVIYDALYSALAITDSVLQIWLTLTFAVIVSTYVAGKRFDRLIYRLVSGLYAFASVIQLTRFCSAAYQGFHYKDLLAERGFEPWPVPGAVSVVIGAGSVLLLVLGTLGTLWFVRVTWRGVEESRPVPD